MKNTRIRMIEKADLEIINAIDAEKRRAIGLPEVKPDKELPTEGFVVEIDGQVIGALVGYKVMEFSVSSNDPRILRALAENHEKIRFILESKGYTHATVFAPEGLINNRRKSGLESLLNRCGFKRVKGFIGFSREVSDGPK